MRRFARLLITAAATLVLTACVLVPRDDRIRGHGAWTVAPGDGWTSTPAQNGGFALARAGSSPDETIAIAMWPERVQQPVNAVQLEERVRRHSMTDEGSRFSLVHADTSVYQDRIEGNSCAAYNVTFEDREAVKRTKREGIMLLDIRGTLCVHPQDERLLVNRHVSRRYYPEFADAAWPETARKLLARVHLDFINTNEPVSTE